VPKIEESLEFFTLEGKYAAFRPEGECTFNQAVDMIDTALAYCKDHKIRGLLVDIRSLTGFPPPSTTQRFQFATQWAATAAGRVCLSVIARQEIIDPDRIGVTMAHNRGLLTQVFTNEADAVAWLHSVGC
jgi:hypothetical protein